MNTTRVYLFALCLVAHAATSLAVPGDLVSTFTNPAISPPADWDQFGAAIAASEGKIVVGSPNVERANVFDAATGEMLLELHYTGLNAGQTQFGAAVALIGGKVLVGAPLAAYFYDPQKLGIGYAGLVHVFDATTGELLQILHGPVGDEANPVLTIGRTFGAAIAAFGDDYLISATGYYPGYQLQVTPHVYIIDSVTGEALHDFIDPVPFLPADNFGTAISVDGNRIVIGSSGGEADTQPYYYRRGLVYVYDRTTRELIFQLIDPTPKNGSYFGDAIAATGGIIAVSADQKASTLAGRICIFNAETGAWIRTIERPSGDAKFAKVLAGNQGYLIAGGPSGVHLFAAASGQLISTLSNPEPDIAGEFGAAVAFFGENVLVSAPTHPNLAPHRDGKVYQFEGPPYEGRGIGDFNNSRCTDVVDFLIVLDYWQSEFEGTIIGASEYLAVLDHWQAGGGCV